MKTLVLLLGLALLLSCLLTLTDCGSTRVTSADDPLYGAPRSGRAEPSQPAKAPPLILGPEDLINVEIWRQDDMKRDLRADRQGDIYLPLAGRVNIAGQNLGWLRFELTERLKKYYKDPQVMVNLVESPLQKAFILGEVTRPGSYRITAATSVMQLISEAGGFTDDAELDSVLLIRGNIEMGRVISLDIRAVVEEADLSQDWYLLRGDIVYVNRTAIADVELFARRLATIISPALMSERTLIFGSMVPDAVLHGDVDTRVTIN